MLYLKSERIPRACKEPIERFRGAGIKWACVLRALPGIIQATPKMQELKQEANRRAKLNVKTKNKHLQVYAKVICDSSHELHTL